MAESRGEHDSLPDRVQRDPLPADPSRDDPRPTSFVVQRPWGEFRQFVKNERVTVKTITVASGHRLSLQRHRLRAELWQVLDVPLDVTVDDRTWLAQPGELVWIPCGGVHRVGNPGSAAGRILELAFGDFDEDDIERLDDDYAR